MWNPMLLQTRSDLKGSAVWEKQDVHTEQFCSQHRTINYSDLHCLFLRSWQTMTKKDEKLYKTSYSMLYSTVHVQHTLTKCAGLDEMYWQVGRGLNTSCKCVWQSMATDFQSSTISINRQSRTSFSKPKACQVLCNGNENAKQPNTSTSGAVKCGKQLVMDMKKLKSINAIQL